MKPQSDDPIERESTQLRVVGLVGGQTNYDPIRIKELIGGCAWEPQSMFKYYGLTTREETLNPTPDEHRGDRREDIYYDRLNL